MRTFLFAIGLLPLLTTGCNRSSAQNAIVEPAPAAIYKAQRGLQLSPIARQTLGVQTAEAATRSVKNAPAVTAVPTAAVLRTVRGDFVYVINGDWFLRTPVQLGVSDADWVEIKDGLYEGDRVVAQGARLVWLTELQAVNGGVGCADGH